jgi:hypothetical protein
MAAYKLPANISIPDNIELEDALNYKLPPNVSTSDIGLVESFDGDMDTPLDHTAKIAACTDIKFFILDILKAFRNIKKTPTILDLSIGQICQLNGEERLRNIKKKIDEFQEKRIQLNMTLEQSLVHEQTAPLVSQIYVSIAKTGGRKRTRRKKQKRRTKKLKRRS